MRLLGVTEPVGDVAYQIHLSSVDASVLPIINGLLLLFRVIIVTEAFPMRTLGYACYFWGFDMTYIIEGSPNTMVVSVTYVHFNVTLLFIVKTRDATWLIEAGLERRFVCDVVLAIAEPREDLVAEGIHNLDFMIIGVCY